MINILIVEKDFNYIKKITNSLSQENNELRFCGITTTVEETLEFLKNCSVDIILISDEIIKQIKEIQFKNFKNSIVIIISSTKVSQKYNTYSFNYINKKDSTSALNIIIKNLITQNKNLHEINNLRQIIEDEIIYLGYNPAYKGFQYIIETIFILNNLENYYDDNLSKDIYPLVAEKFNTTALNVKYNIRNATEAMYYDCEANKLSKYLGFDISKKPQTKAIICAIANNVKKKVINKKIECLTS